MVNESGPDSRDPTGNDGRSLLARLARPSISKKIGAAFLVLLVLTLGNLLLAERFFDSIADTAEIVNESGRLRYLSQEIAYHATRLAYEKKGSDGRELAQRIEEFDARLSGMERRLDQLHPSVAREFRDMPSRLRTLRDNWLNYRKIVEAIRKPVEDADVAASIRRIDQISDAVLYTTDGIVNELARASQEAHYQADFLLYLVLLAEMVFLLAVFFFLYRKVVQPVKEVSRLVGRFAAGDHSERIGFEGRDEIGELARNFNRTAEMVGQQLAILDAAPDLVGTATPDGRLLYLNRAGRALLGVGADEDITQRHLADCQPDWVGAVLAKVGFPAASNKGIWLGEMAVRGRNGEEVPVSQAIIAHRTPDGAVSHYSTIVRDISDRVALESRLTRSRDSYLKLLLEFPNLVWRSDADGTRDYFNKAWLVFTGRRVEQELGDGWATDVHPDDLDTYLKACREAFGKREPFKIEYRLRRHDGEYRWISDEGAPYEDIDDNFAGYIGACSDITERRLAEEEVRKLSMVVKETGNSVIITDRQGLIEYVNPAFTRVSGYLPEEALGQKPGMLKSGLTPPEHYQKLWQTLLAGEEWRGELLNRKKNGELFWEYEVISPLKNSAGEITHFVAIKEDVTERKRYEEKLRLWERAIDSSVNAILITDATDPNQPLIYTNPAFERITGYSQEEALGRNCRFLQNEDTDQPALEELRHAIREQREGRAVLRNYRKDGSMFWNELLIAPVPDENGKVAHFIGVQNDVTERMSYESQLEHQANYDTLTGLPNRNLLQDRLGQTLAYVRRHERELALLFIDLDYFKNINDSLGHNAGDRLLKLVAVRLAGCVREDDTVSRQGGDEFVVILSDVAAEEDVTIVTRKILKTMADPFDIDGHELYVTCSIGIALYPKDGEDAETLLKNADAALYRAKDQGRDNAQFYSAEMNVKAMERLMLENSLRHALDRNEFLLHYQPRVDLRSGEITGMEALVRWQHPELGLVPPIKFIPVAEESGVIVPLGEWVLRTACAQNKAWQLAGLKPVCVAVNLSARQFRQQDLVEVVTRILKETELDSSWLELELTESLIMQNVEATIATLTKLRATGVKFSIDDFGTGYSSLSYLKRFPIDTLKIDQSFVRDITTDPDDAAIAKTIISMAHDMQLRVVAEGVETEEQKSFLRLRHCDEMQGYFFSRPVPADAFEILLRERRCLQLDDIAAALGQRTLLLLDDEENILTSLTRLLRRDGYRILKATSATAAFELLAEHPVGVIISDQRMPEMSGTEFLRRVKQIYPETVRMVLSGYTDLKSVTDAINEGAVYKFLTKPWDDELLRANIQEAFQRYDLAQDNRRLTAEMTLINDELNRAKRELERRIEQKTSEAQYNVGVLQISQEILEYLPVGVIGVGEDGLIAVANRKANELFEKEDKEPLVGGIAARRLPDIMIEYLAGAGEGRHVCRLESGRNVVFWSHAMGASSGSQGRVLVIVPSEESAD